MTEWRPVVGWEGLYEVSELGEVRSLDRVIYYPDGRRPYTKKGRTLRGWVKHGYRKVVLSAANGRKEERFVHSLVLESFIGPRPAGQEALHYDDNKQNNVTSNLRWGTRSENLHDMVRNGRHRSARKTHCKRGHEFTAENTKLQSNGGRACVECLRTAAREAARIRYGYKSPRTYWDDTSHCANGHLKSEENTYTNPGSGSRSCRECRSDYARTYYQNSKSKRGRQ